MIRILHFAGIINRWDIVDVVLTRLDRSRFEVFALTGLPPRQTGTYAPEEVYRSRCLNIEASKRNYARLLHALLTELRRVRPHVLQAHHYHENIVAAIAVRMLRIPCYVVGRHYSDHIYYLTKGIKRRVFLSGEAFANRTANRIAVPAPDIAEMLTVKQGVPPSKINVIPFGLDLRKFRASSERAPELLRSRYGLANHYVGLVCCRLNPEKGLDSVIRALPSVRQAHPEFRLVVVGTGSEETHLRELSRSLRVDDIIQFLGWRDDALDWIAAADVVIQPSLCESFCQVLMEALAFSKPIIMTPVGAAPQVIGQNQRGLLVPLADSGAISAALRQLIQTPNLGRDLGSAGRKYLESNLDADVTTRQYEALYESILDEVGYFPVS